MRCQVALNQLQDLLEDRLPPEQAAELRSHLAACPGCAAEFEAWRGLWEDLSGLALAPRWPDLEGEIMTALGRLPVLPKGLILLFALACLGTLSGFLSWAKGLEAQKDLVSACLWIAAGAVSVLTVWLAVKRSSHVESTVISKTMALSEACCVFGTGVHGDQNRRDKTDF
ncbi:MAG: anti-sigma factor family protein [Patescibacteria group bacterium]